MVRLFGLTVAATVTVLVSIINPALAEIKSLSDLPQINSKSLGSSKTPRSRPIIIYDSFTEKSLPAVMDVNYHDNLLTGEKKGIVTLWSMTGITVGYYYHNGFGKKVSAILKDGLLVKVDGTVYTLPPAVDSIYPMTPELHQALMNSSNQVFIRVSDSDKQIDSEIGRGTINAYQELGVYFSKKQQ